MKTKKRKKEGKASDTWHENGGPAVDGLNGNHLVETPRLRSKVYEKELARLQIELIKLQEWVKHEGLKVVVLFRPSKIRRSCPKCFERIGRRLRVNFGR